MNTRPHRLCQGTKKGGGPCGANAAKGSLYCFLHDPERAEERREWSRRGGRASSTQRRLAKLTRQADELNTDELLRLLSGAMLLMLEGKLEPGHVSALASAAKTLEGIRSTSELQARVDALEATLSASTRRIG